MRCARSGTSTSWTRWWTRPANPRLTEAAAAPARESLPPLLDKAWRKLAKEVKALTLDGPADEWHETRITAKRARYAAEALAPVFGAPAKSLASALGGVTEQLGEHQDAAIAQEMCRSLAGKFDGPTGFSLGLLHAYEVESELIARVRLREQWPVGEARSGQDAPELRLPRPVDAHKGESIRAAGVVLTRGVGKDLEVAVIHRPRRSDWSLPKGKFEPGEHSIEVAVRECQEETGFTPVLDVPLPTQHYGSKGRPEGRRVLAGQRRVSGEFAENKEVDRLRWLRPREAAAVVTYPRDGELIRLATRTPPTIPFVLLRHTRAEKRGGLDPAHRPGPGGSRARHCSSRGEWEARRIVPLLQAYGIRPLALLGRRALPGHAAPAGRGARAGDPPGADDLRRRRSQPIPDRGTARTVEIFGQPWASVLCSHRPVIPDQLDALRAAGGGPPLLHRVAPGSFFVFHRTWLNRPTDVNVRIVAAEQHDVPPTHE